MIDRAREEDLPALEAVAKECGLQVDFAVELARPYALLRVARLRGELCAFALAWRAADELHLTDLGVLTAERRRGLGRLLLESLCAEGQRSGARVMLLEVRESNAPAIALYEGLGFTELYRRARYYSDTDEDAVMMELTLSESAAAI